MILKRIVLIGGLLFLLIMAGWVLTPRYYNVLSFQEREGTKYWELSSGSRIGYTKLEHSGKAVKPPIIYLHGGPGGIVTDEIIELHRPLASQGYDMYLYDQIGSGHSGRLSDIKEYTVERHVNDLKEIIGMITDDKVIIIGQSWGAMLAMEYLAQHTSQYVDKMILTGPGPILPIKRGLTDIPAPDSLNLKNPAFTNKEGNEKAYNIRSKFLRFCATAFGVKMSTDKEADEFFTFLCGELNKSTKCDPSELVEPSGGRGYYAHVRTLKSFNLIKDRRYKLKKLDTPILIIKGQCDNQPWGFAAEYLDQLPGASLNIIEGAGHIVGIEQRDEYLDTIITFLN